MKFASAQDSVLMKPRQIIKTPKVFDRFYNSSSSEDEDDGVSGSSQNDSVQKRLDYMIQFLDRKLSTSTSPDTGKNKPLPEFIGTNGGSGVFKPPFRAPVHHGSPPKCGIRVWDLKNDTYGCGAQKGEEGTVRYWESVQCPATLCVVGDTGNGVVWSGHKDGRIRCWKMMDFNGNGNDTVNRSGFKEALSWQAHRGPVLSMAVTSYGISLS
ncbi:unnamed protein product [Fraxinus pennsylvanica]|uniref:IP5PC-F beta-propeller domain-containing protein n=1 Tax=Fraxinus pennsylvanica TaxID=56036 RepID=A0AAD2DZU2_9LAMI|nr:unnamed protein product [Fraxinus pennsylvanica]